MNYKQVFAMKANREKQIKDICPNIPNTSGIYIFFRTDENGINHCYVGQAKHLLERTASHLAEYDHIALSLKKRKFYSESNPYGWKLTFAICSIENLDTEEKEAIKCYAGMGYQLYNVTAGGQGEGKTQLKEYKPSKGYRDGLKQGYINASREVSNLFDKHLNYSKKSDKPNKNQDKAIEKLETFLDFYKNGVS